MIKNFIRKGVFTICLNLMILLLGIFTLPYLSNEFIPSIEIPAVAIVVPMPLTTNTNIIRQTVHPVEQAFIESGEVNSLETRIEDGKAIFVLFYKWDFSPSFALRRARQVMSKVELPKEALKPIFVLHRPSNNPILRLAFYGGTTEDLNNYAKNLLSTMERIPGVSKVAIGGEFPKKLQLKVNNEKLSYYGLNASDVVINAKKIWSFRQFVPAKPVNHYITSPFDNQSSLNLLPVFSDKLKKMIPLNWIGSIEETKPEPPIIFGKNNPAIIIEIIKAPGSDTLSIIRESLKKLTPEEMNQKKIQHQVLYNEAEKIVDSQWGVYKNFFIGVLLNSIILMIFLGSKIGVVVASVVFPTALLGTLFIMKMLGISINLFSLNGFSLAVGMITDASTVVLESIVRKIKSQEEIFSACWKGSQEVALGVLASTLTTAGVLLPIAMQKNISSKLFSDLSLTVVSTQLVCLVAVFSLVPWLCFTMFQNEEKKSKIIDYLYSLSTKIVNALIFLSKKVQMRSHDSKKFRITFPSLVIFFSLSMMLFLPKTEFLPQVSSSVFSFYYPIPRSKIDTQSDFVRTQLAKAISQEDNLKWSLLKKTQDGIEGQLEFKATSTVSHVKSLFTHAKLLDTKRMNILPIGPAPTGEAMGFTGLYFLKRDLSSQKYDNILTNFCGLPQVDYCYDVKRLHRTNIKITPKHLTTLRMGITGIESASQIFLPLHEINMAEIGNIEFQKPVYLHIPGIGSLLDHSIETTKETRARVGDLFHHDFKTQKTLVQRLNGHEFTPLFFRLKDSTLGEIDTLMEKIKEKFNTSISSVLGQGEMATMNETFLGMIKALSLSAVIVFLILAIQFKSIAQTLIIMGTIPLTLGGAIIGLIIMDETVNASVMVGFILLIGIVVNNGIFLVEATNQKLMGGMDIRQAVSLSVEERTRPILMTSFSTIFGMLPAILFQGEGSELYRGMAIVNIFGMIVGTVLSLVVTPLFIEYFSNNKKLRTIS